MGAGIYADGTYARLHPDWHAGDSAWKAARIAEMLGRNRLRPASVAEVGCGAGGVLAALAAHAAPGARLVGFDVSPQAVAMARARHAGLPVEFVEGDAAASGERFELMVAADVFEHVPDCLGFLASIRPRADAFAFHVPLDLSVSSVLRPGALLRARRESGHLHHFVRETALATLEDAGYRVRDEAYTRGGIELAGPGLGRRLARLPRAAAAAVSPAWAARVLGGFSLLVLAEPAAP